MTTGRKLNDDTQELNTLKTILDLAALPKAGASPSRAANGSHDQSDLISAKTAASLLTMEEMKELSTWLEGRIGRRDAF